MWARAENVKEGAVYLDFVLDVNEMKNTNNTAERTSKIFEIFITYIPEKSAKKKLVIDTATRKTIMLAFEHRCYDHQIFDLAYEKAYQCLKFDHMPQFLISNAFMNLEQGTQVRRGSSSKVIEMSSILNEQQALLKLGEFLRKREDGKELSYLKLWENINDFKKDYAKQTAGDQNKRAKKIWEEVVKSCKLPSHLRVLTNENVNGNNNPSSGPGMDCFDDLQNFLADILQANIQRPFLVSQEYSNFLNSASEEYKLDSVVLTLSEFKDDRQLKKTKDNYVQDLNMALRLENVLEDPLLSAYFRRFLRLSFQEENFLFFQDVQDMKVQHYVKAASKEINPDMSLEDILRVSAMKIFEKFVKNSSIYQVNISAEIYSKIHKRIEEDDFQEDMYDDAQREIFLQMRSGGFMEFKKHDLFEHFKKNHKRKFAQRHFVVGFAPKKNNLPSHYERAESSLNFDEVRSHDKDFCFDTHLRNKKASVKLDYITAKNVQEFHESFQAESNSPSGLHAAEKKPENESTDEDSSNKCEM